MEPDWHGGKTARCALLILAACSVIGCGGGDAPADSRFKVQPCGGDVVGEWRVEALCVTRAALEASFAEIAAGSFCPTQTLGNDTRGASGSLALNGDLTYAMSVTVTGTTEFNVPASCLGGASCADVSASLHAEIAAGLYLGILAGSCSGTLNCLCHEVLSQPLSGSGTYSTAGAALTADGVLGDAQYCVQGSTVHFLATAMAGMPQVDLVGVGRRKLEQAVFACFSGSGCPRADCQAESPSALSSPGKGAAGPSCQGSHNV